MIFGFFGVEKFLRKLGVAIASGQFTTGAHCDMKHVGHKCVQILGLLPKSRGVFSCLNRPT